MCSCVSLLKQVGNSIVRHTKVNERRLTKRRKKIVRSGIRTHAYISRLRPERSALDHSAILTACLVVLISPDMTN